MTIPKDIKLLIDLTLGDGYIGLKSNKYTTMRIEHAIKQKAYAQHKERLLTDAGFNVLSRELTIENGKNAGKSYYRIDIHGDNRLATAHKHIYNKGRKFIDKHLLRDLDILSLAYWFMDDGSAKLSHYNLKKDQKVIYELPKIGVYKFSHCGFTFDENKLFCDWLKYKFNIDAMVIKHGKFYVSAIYTISAKDRFRYLIEPYIIPSMYYKIMFPHSFSGIPFTKTLRNITVTD
jgi:hypothetical protein